MRLRKVWYWGALRDIKTPGSSRERVVSSTIFDIIWWYVVAIVRWTKRCFWQRWFSWVFCTPPMLTMSFSRNRINGCRNCAQENWAMPCKSCVGIVVTTNHSTVTRMSRELILVRDSSRSAATISAPTNKWSNIASLFLRRNESTRGTTLCEWMLVHSFMFLLFASPSFF